MTFQNQIGKKGAPCALPLGSERARRSPGTWSAHFGFLDPELQAAETRGLLPHPDNSLSCSLYVSLSSLPREPLLPHCQTGTVILTRDSISPAFPTPTAGAVNQRSHR